MKLIPIWKFPYKGCRDISKAAAVAYAEVDDDVAMLASSRNWHLHGLGYARSGRTMLHHLVLPKRPGFDVAHLDGNRLNCKRSNLEYQSHSKNMLNRADKLRADNNSGIRGVYFDGNARGKKWRGRVRVGRVVIATKRFATKEEAAGALSQLLQASGMVA